MLTCCAQRQTPEVGQNSPAQVGQYSWTERDPRLGLLQRRLEVLNLREWTHLGHWKLIKEALVASG
jgi:hypothetical protein